jgi:hypothetical protein
MKKIKYFLPLFVISLLFTSCFEKLDNWYTNTAAYDGRFTVATTCDEYSDYDQTIRYGNELWIYNSAANVANQIIIDSHVAIDVVNGISFPVQGKFDVSGTPSDFKATQPTTNIMSSTSLDKALNDDEYYVVDEDGNPIAYISDLDDPEGLGEEYPGVQQYARLSIDEGKIIPKGATTIGVNVSDSVYVAIKTYADYLTIESYQTPENTWAVQGVPEFGWRSKAGSRTKADGWEEHWKLAGYRYTGFPEDNPSTLPPTTEKK